MEVLGTQRGDGISTRAKPPVPRPPVPPRPPVKEPSPKPPAKPPVPRPPVPPRGEVTCPECQHKFTP